MTTLPNFQSKDDFHEWALRVGDRQMLEMFWPLVSGSGGGGKQQSVAILDAARGDHSHQQQQSQQQATATRVLLVSDSNNNATQQHLSQLEAHVLVLQAELAKRDACIATLLESVEEV